MYLIHARLRRRSGPADPTALSQAAARHATEMAGVDHICAHLTDEVDVIVLSAFVRAPTIESAESSTLELCERLVLDETAGSGWEVVSCWAGMVAEYYERLASCE